MEMFIDRLTGFLVEATPLHVSNRSRVRARKESVVVCVVDSQRFPIHFTSLLVT